VIVDKLKELGISVSHYDVIPDEVKQIQKIASDYATHGVQLIIFTGGTGLSMRDVTPEALEPLLERRIPGIEETIRRYGQERMPFAMLSRSVAGTIKDSLVLALPGSTKGAAESMDAVFPAVIHLFNILKGANHDE
jgi:cyclic pyranopterin phosphate synthase